MKTINDYMDTFAIAPPRLEQLTARALSKGGDFCDLYFEHTTYMNLLLKDGEVTSGGSHTDYGVGIRVLKGEKTGYAYSESTSMADMLAAADAASAIACSPAEPRHYARTADRRYDLYPSRIDWRTAKVNELVRVLKDLEAAIKVKDTRIVKIIARISCSVSDVLMYNSSGELTTDSRPMGSLIASVVFQQNGKTESKSVSRSFRMGAEMLSKELIDELAAEAVSGIDERFEAIRPAGGQMPVVMGAGASGILLHEAMGHAFEADFNRKGQSIFAGRLGEKICSDKISIIDDGTIAGNRGSGNYDDEGVPAQKTYMVEHGILTSYLHDRISAAWYGVPSTGNGRRESFRYNPIPRMRATYMEDGDTTREDIIRSVKKGIYVDEFSNGQVKIGEGDFTFYVKSGFLIEDGRLTAPIKDINVIGNGPEALADISMVAADLKIDNGTWTCGKEQNVPVTCGIPTVLVDHLTVGGE